MRARYNNGTRLALRPLLSNSRPAGWCCWNRSVRPNATTKAHVVLRFKPSGCPSPQPSSPHRSSRREEAPTSFSRNRMSLLTSAATRFMGSLLSLLRTHWDHEPLRLTEARSGPRVCDPQPARFMERPPRTLIAPCALEPGSWAGCFRDGGTKYPPSFGGGFTCSPR